MHILSILFLFKVIIIGKVKVLSSISIKLNNKVKVFKAFPVHKSESIEEQYQKYLESTNNQDERLTRSKSFYSAGEGDEVFYFNSNLYI